MISFLRSKYSKITVALLALIGTVAFVVVAFNISVAGKTTVYTLYVNDEQVAQTTDEEELYAGMRQSRLRLGRQEEGMFLSDADFRVEQTEAFFLYPDKLDVIAERVEEYLLAGESATLNRSYTVKINEYTTNLATADEVMALLQGSVDQYDEEGLYTIELELDRSSELNVLTAEIVLAEKEEEIHQFGGIEKNFEDIEASIEAPVERAFEDFELGLQNIYFTSTVEVVEAYLLDSQLTPLEVAIDEVTKKQEKEEIYEIQSGDTLGGISMTTNIPLDRLIEINPTLESENTVLRTGDELIITVPEPELTVMHTRESYYEEDYEAEIIYVDNDEWYTTKQVTLQQPSSGHHNVIVRETYRNDVEVDRTILKEEVIMDAVPKIVERGTIVPPTYIKPLSGGRTSSTFGYRRAPTAGASTQHKGHDWATPTGTAIVASSAGTVTKAGWGGGYGYVVYINHSDGRQTRYAHLSKVLVSPGQYVQQGQKIALSGNTGVSSGPHLHFEMIINGVHVNPIKYLD